MENNSTGHEALIIDLSNLIREAVEFEFHDFKNSSYVTPKIELAQKLHELRQNVINGKYDN